MKYQIWYMKPSFLRGIVGNSPDPNDLSATHVHLKDIEADSRDDALDRMQAHIWSPNGEALDLIGSKGPPAMSCRETTSPVSESTFCCFSLFPVCRLMRLKLTW